MKRISIFENQKSIVKIRWGLLICCLLAWSNLSLLAMGPPHGDYSDKSIRELLDLFDSKDPDIRAYAAIYLGWRYDEYSWPAFDGPIIGTNSPAPELPIPDAVIPRLRTLLKSDPELNVKCGALNALEALRSRTNTTPIIMEALDDDSAVVRFYAAKSLNAISERYHERLPDAVIPTLLVCLDSNGKPDIKLDAARLLGIILEKYHQKLPDAAIPILSNSLNPSGAFYQLREAANTIGSMGAAAKPLVPALEKLANDPSDAQVRQVALAALDKINQAIVAERSGYKPPLTAAEVMAMEPYLTLAKKDATKDELKVAVSKLTLPPLETPEFWTRIANDPDYSFFQRRLAVDELFQRCTKEGMNLINLLVLLNHPTWIKLENIKAVNAVSGVTSMGGKGDGTIFALNVLPVENEDHLVVYLQFWGKVDEQGFKGVMVGNPTMTIDNATIAAIDGVEDIYPSGKKRYWAAVLAPPKPPATTAAAKTTARPANTAPAAATATTAPAATTAPTATIAPATVAAPTAKP